MDDADRALLALRCADETGLRLSDVLALPADALQTDGSLRCALADGASIETRRFRLSRLLRNNLRRLAPAGRAALLFTDSGGAALAPSRLATLWGAQPEQGGPGLDRLHTRWSEDVSSRHISMRAQRAVAQSLREALQGISGPRLVEIGCAYGSHLRGWHREIIGPAEGRSLGIERVAGIVSVAAASGEGPAWVCADGQDLPLRDGSAHAIVCVEVFEHLPVPARLLTEIRRCLRPGGILIATTPNPSSPYAFLARTRRWAQSFGPKDGLESLRKGYVPMVDPRETEKLGVYRHVSLHTPGEWAERFSQAGLSLRRILPISLALPNLLFRRRGALTALRLADAILPALPMPSWLYADLCYIAQVTDQPPSGLRGRCGGQGWTP